MSSVATAPCMATDHLYRLTDLEPRATRTKKTSSITSSEQNQYVEWYGRGFDVEDIADAFGREAKDVRKWLNEAGWGERFGVTRKEVNAWIELYSKGWGLTDIRKMSKRKVLRAPGTISYHLARRGIMVRHPRLTRELKKILASKVH